MAQRLKTDWILFLTVILLVCFGLVMVYSASSFVAALKYHISTTYFFFRSPSKLAKEEVGGRNMVFQCSDEGRCAVYHHQAKAHEQDDREKEDPICFQSLRHELRQFCHDLFEYFAAMFKVLKLVKAGTSGGQKHNVARLGMCSRVLDSRLESAAIDSGNSAFECLLNTRSSSVGVGWLGPDQQSCFRALLQRVAKRGIVAALIFTA